MPSKQALPSQDELAEAFAACQAYEAFLQQQSTSLERATPGVPSHPSYTFHGVVPPPPPPTPSHIQIPPFVRPRPHHEPHVPEEESDAFVEPSRKRPKKRVAKRKESRANDFPDLRESIEGLTGLVEMSRETLSEDVLDAKMEMRLMMREIAATRRVMAGLADVVEKIYRAGGMEMPQVPELEEMRMRYFRKMADQHRAKDDHQVKHDDETECVDDGIERVDYEVEGLPTGGHTSAFSYCVLAGIPGLTSKSGGHRSRWLALSHAWTPPSHTPIKTSHDLRAERSRCPPTAYTVLIQRILKIAMDDTTRQQWSRVVAHHNTIMRLGLHFGEQLGELLEKEDITSDDLVLFNNRVSLLNIPSIARNLPSAPPDLSGQPGKKQKQIKVKVEKLDVKKKGRQQQVPDESETVGFEAMTIKSSGPDEDDTFAQAGKATKRAVVLVNPKRAQTIAISDEDIPVKKAPAVTVKVPAGAGKAKKSGRVKSKDTVYTDDDADTAEPAEAAPRLTTALVKRKASDGAAEAGASAPERATHASSSSLDNRQSKRARLVHVSPENYIFKATPTPTCIKMMYEHPVYKLFHGNQSSLPENQLMGAYTAFYGFVSQKQGAVEDVAALESADEEGEEGNEDMETQ